jgi:hypothetical protein
MRKVFLILGLCLLPFISGKAQSVREGELAVVYYTPQTQIVIDIDYESVILHRGIYADFAKKYLGTAEVVKDDDMWYRITNISTHTQTVADHSRMHKVDSNLPLTLTADGILEAYNGVESQKGCTKGQCTMYKGTMDNVQSTKVESQESRVESQEPRVESKVLPLLEEHIVGKTLAEQAQGAAKLIYRIRENRLYLISGEVDKMPADGRAMELAINKLDEMEQQLVELFVGRIEVERHRKTIVYTPVATEKTDLAYFSEQHGFTNATNGDPIVMNINARRQIKGNPNSDKKKAPIPSQISYNLPGTANYKVSYLNELSDEADIQVAQFGVDVPLAQDLFEGKQQPHIYFNTQTGNIESIEN